MKKLRYKNNEFEIVANNLEILNKSVDLLLEYDILTKEYSKKLNIDTSVIEQYQRQILVKETALSQLKAVERNEEQDKQLKQLESSIKELSVKMDNDEQVIEVIAKQNQVFHAVLLKLATDEKFMNKLFEGVLIGDLEVIKVTNEDMQEYLRFAGEVLSIFFTITQQNSQE